MTIFRILVVVLALSSSAFADGGALTPIERDPCLMMPEIKMAETAVAGTDYIAEFDEDCDFDYHPAICNDFQKINIIYHYNIVTTTDYYNSDGKVVVSKSKKVIEVIKDPDVESGQEGSWSQVSFSLGLSPDDDAAKAQMKRQYERASVLALTEIRTKIREGMDTGMDVCEGSFYK